MNSLISCAQEIILEFLECGGLGFHHSCVCNSDYLDKTMHGAGLGHGFGQSKGTRIYSRR